MDGPILGQPAPADTSRFQPLARIALAFGLLVLGLWTLQEFMRALIWAGVLAIAIWPLYVRVRSRCWASTHREIVPSAATLIVALVFVLPLGLLATQLGREGHSLVSWALEAQRQGLPVPDAVSHLPIGSDAVRSWWQANLADPKSLSELLGRVNREDVMSYSREFGVQIARRTVLLTFTLVTMFFLFRDGDTVTRQMDSASRRAFGPSGERLGRQIVASVHGTVNGLVLVGVGEGILLGIAYAIAGVPHPTLFGAVTAIAAMIPFGAPIIFGVAALLLLAQGSMITAAVLFGFGMAVAFIADHAIRPVLIGGATQLPFLWVLLGILGGVETFGLLGLFVGPAIMAALILLWREWTDHPQGSVTPVRQSMVE